MRYTDYNQIRLLAKSILTDDKKMIALADGLYESLNQLKSTFLDDGYDEVEAYANALIQKLSNAQEAFLLLAQELLEYARLLEMGKGNTGAHLECNPLSPAIFVVQPIANKPPDINASGQGSNHSTPRDLIGTQFGMVKDSDGDLVYDSPLETDQYLYKNQGTADPNFQGTCGLCSCANILRLAGVNATEAQMIEYASTTNYPDTLFQKLCTTGFSDSGMNGGTSPKSRQVILRNFGIDSGVFPLEREKSGSLSNRNLAFISDSVSAGRGVILSVHADILWNDAPMGIDDYHAVTVTSVKKDHKGNILGFYICDSAQNGTAYYSAEKVKRSLTGAPMNVTYSIIR